LEAFLALQDWRLPLTKRQVFHANLGIAYPHLWQKCILQTII